MSYHSLKDQPIFNGETSYCNPSFHLVNHRFAGAPALESELARLNKVGPMLGTKMSYGRRRKFKSKRRRHRFSKPPFKSGKLSTSVGPDIGLPLGAKSPITIFDTQPNMMMQGAPLPRPYGPRDNLRMQSLYKIHGFGRVRRNRRKSRRKSRRRKRYSKSRKSRRRKSRRKSRKRSSKKRRRRRRRSYGMTPGTKSWIKSGLARNNMSAQAAKYANPGALKTAKGLFKSDIDLMVKGLGNKQHLTPFLNEPLQFSNNAANTPVLKFGRRKFGFSNNSPNTVAYQKPIPMYHAGGTTINFATNQLYSPEGLIPKVGKVQPDGMTPNAWLTRSTGIGDGLGGVFRFGSKKRKPKKKLNKRPSLSSLSKTSLSKTSSSKKKTRKFGEGVYTPDGWVKGSGHLTVKQPKPNLGPKKVTGSFMSRSYGTASYRSYGKKKIPKRKGPLKTNFGGKTITLDSSGKISVN